MTAVRVGILDSGLAGDLVTRAVDHAAFVVTDDFTVAAVPWCPDPIGHGTAIARLVIAAAPAVEILSAQVFVDRGTTSAAVAAAGLDWLRGQGAQMVTMSFGLRHDRDVLRRACAAAAEVGIILVGSAPARGAPVYPAAYPSVVAVTGDARCAPGEISHLGGAAAFGACPRPPTEATGGGATGGASFAVGHLCGLVAAAMGAGEVTSAADVHGFLLRHVRYRGRERGVATDG